MTYIENCKKHQQTIVDNYEPARLVNNMFTPDEIEQLSLLQFQLADRLKWAPSSNNMQPVCDVNKLFEHMPVLKEKFQKEIGEFSDNHSGNFYITTQLHDAHVDLLSERECSEEWTNNIIPYKSCVIPLMITNWSDAQTAFFDQRHIGYSVTLDRLHKSEQGNSDYTVAREYPECTTIDGKIADMQKEYKRETEFLFPQIPSGNLRGLSIEKVFTYTPGDVMLFDACQIHASCTRRSKPNYRWLKSGINIQFYKEV